jgi:hypothetical protein
MGVTLSSLNSHQKPRVQLSEMACGTHSRTDTGSGFMCFITPPPLPTTIHDCNIPPIALNIEHTVTSHVFKFRASFLNGTWLVTE